MQRTRTVSIPTELDPVMGERSREEMLDRELILKGRFDAEIKRLQAIKAAAEAKAGIVATLEEAEIIRRSAEETESAVKRKVEAMTTRCDAYVLEADSRMKTVAQREAGIVVADRSMQERERAVDGRAGELDRRERVLGALEAQRDEAYKARMNEIEKELVRGRSEISGRETALAVREKRLKARLEAIRLED